MSQSFPEHFLSRSTKKLRRGTLLCCVSENFGHQKSLKKSRKAILQDRDSKLRPPAWERCCSNPIAVNIYEKKELAVLQWKKQDGRLAPAFFSQENKRFDQHLPTVISETTVQIIVYESFLQKTIPPLLYRSYAKEGELRISFKTFCLTLPRNFVGEQFGVSEKNVYL